MANQATQISPEVLDRMWDRERHAGEVISKMKGFSEESRLIETSNLKRQSLQRAQEKEAVEEAAEYAAAQGEASESRRERRAKMSSKRKPRALHKSSFHQRAFGPFGAVHRETYLHPTKGWRSRALMPAQPQPAGR